MIIFTGIYSRSETFPKKRKQKKENRKKKKVLNQRFLFFPLHLPFAVSTQRFKSKSSEEMSEYSVEV